MFKRIALIALAVAAPLAQAATFTTLTLPTLNLDIRTLSDGTRYNPLFPGTSTFNGVPFQFAVDGSGNTAFQNDGLNTPSSGVLDIPVGVFGVTQAYTIINSRFGRVGALPNGSVSFIGSVDTVTVNLIQGSNIRDHFNGMFNNTIDGVNAVGAFNPGAGANEARLDEQIFNLPVVFAGQTLTTIRFTGLDLGADGLPFIAAATVGIAAAVPEPETYVLMLAGLGVIGWAQRRRRA